MSVSFLCPSGRWITQDVKDARYVRLICVLGGFRAASHDGTVLFVNLP